MNSESIYSLLMQFESEKELANFFEITFTEKEQDMMLERWRIFSALKKGLSQRDVAKTVACSVATATRGAKVFRDNEEQISDWLEEME